MAFYYEWSAFQVAVAPWRRDRRQQRVVKAYVTVAEQRTPGFALRYDIGVEMGGVLTHLMRLVSQRQMLQAFEFAFVGEEAADRRPPGGDGENKVLDQRLKAWLAGGGQVPKEELARWLLSWMLVMECTGNDLCSDKMTTNEWFVLMCGEKGAEGMVEEEENFTCDNEAGDAREPVLGGEDIDTFNNEDDDDDDNSREGAASDDELPPPYMYEDGKAAESEISSPDSSIVSGVLIPEKERQRAVVRHSATKLSKRTLSIRSNSRYSVASTRSAKSIEKTELKPTIVMLNPRPGLLNVQDIDKPAPTWSTDRWKHHQELRALRRAVQIAKQQHNEKEKFAELQHKKLLKESARKLYVKEQKQREAQAVEQLIGGTVEYRDELTAIESRMKQASVAAYRDAERVKRKTRAMLSTTDCSLRGVLTPGSNSRAKQEKTVLCSDAKDVYDLHGRQHKSETSDQITAKSALESAMWKVRRFLQSGENVDMFRRLDLSRSGTLSYRKLQRLLRKNGNGGFTELTQEQSVALFQRFGRDGSGEIDYCEMLWEFFNREAFRKRWRGRKSATTDREVRRLFSLYDSSSQGVLPLEEFQVILDRIGVVVSDIDARLLAVKFDADKVGYIDYHKFLAYFKVAETHPSALAKQNRESPVAAPPGMERLLMDLQTLTATQEKLHRLFRK